MTTLAAALVVVLLVVGVHWPALGGGFVFDDRLAIIRDEARIDALWPPSAWLADTQRPLVQGTLALNHAIGGLDPAGYHAFNIGVHALNALLLMLVVSAAIRVLVARGLSRLSPRAATVVSAGAALLWALHPATTAASAYIVQRAESMAASFSLLALLAILSAPAVRRGRAASALRAVSVFAAVLAAVVSKPTAVALPALLLVVDGCVGGGGLRGALRRHRPLHAAAWTALGALFVTGVVQGIFVGTGRMTGGGVGVVSTGLVGYWLLEVRALAVYAATVVDPSRLSIDHGTGPLAPLWTLPVGAALLAAMVGGSVGGLARGRWWAVLPAAVLVLLAPTMLVPLADPLADQRLYLPLAAVAVAVVSVFAPWLAGRGRRALVRAVPLGLLAVVGVLEARATMARAADYADPIGLWSEVVDRDPFSTRARVNRAGLLLEAGRDREAAADLAVALEREPGNPTALLNAGILDLKAGRFEEAMERLKVASGSIGSDAALEGAIGDAARALGRHEEAAVAYRRAARLAPNDVRYLVMEANALTALGELDEAAALFELAAERADGAALRASALFNLGNTMFRQERYAEAAESYRRALAADPSHEGAATWLEEAEAADAE